MSVHQLKRMAQNGPRVLEGRGANSDDMRGDERSLSAAISDGSLSVSSVRFGVAEGSDIGNDDALAPKRIGV